MRERRTNKYGLGLAPRARKEKFWYFFVVFCVSVAIASVSVRAKFPHKPPGTLAHPLALADLASESTGPNFSFSSRFFLTVAFPWLSLTPINCLGPCLSSSSSGLVGNLVRKHFVWVSRQSRQRNPLTGVHPHLQKRMPLHYATNVIRIVLFLKLKKRNTAQEANRFVHGNFYWDRFSYWFSVTS